MLEKNSFNQLERQLTRGIRDLEVVSDVVSKFVAWLNKIKLESTVLMNQGDMVSQKFDKIQMMSIEVMWKNHRSQYPAYVHEVSRVFFEVDLRLHDVFRLGESRISITPRVMTLHLFGYYRIRI